MHITVNSSQSCQKQIIYKPSNQSFMTQGAVSSSTNTAKKRYKTLTNNYATLKSTYKQHYIIPVERNGNDVYYKKGDTTSNKDCLRTFRKCN